VANSASCYDRIENIWILSVVEPERKLIQIQRQIFTAHVMIVADDSAFQQAPKVLNRVRVNGADNVLMQTVIDALMRHSVSAEIPITGVLIGRNQRYFVRHGGAHKILIRRESEFIDRLADYIPFASNRADHHRLVGQMAASARSIFALVGVLVLIFSADVSFVGLDDAFQREYVAPHGRPDARAHIPRGFVRAASDHPMDLKCAHPLLAREHQEDHREPFAQRIVGVLKHRARDHAEAIAIRFVADGDFASRFVHALRTALAKIMKRPRLERVSLCAASRAFHHAIGPALLFQKRLARGLIGKAAE